MSGQILENDKLKLYRELAGDYEYYSDLQYFYFTAHQNLQISYRVKAGLGVLGQTDI
jgi:hypothetical protein